MIRKRSTMKDVAEAAGVSRTTVSFVFKNRSDIPEVTRQRVLEVAQQLNYAPNVHGASLATGRTMIIGLVLRQTSEQMAADAFLSQVVQGITQAIEPAGYHLLVHAAQPDAPGSQPYAELVWTKKVDGLIIASPVVDDPEVIRLHEDGVPIVVHGGMEADDIASIDVDNVQGAYAAVRHLLGLGHERIGYISNAPLSYISSRERLAGYREALEEWGIAYDEALVQQGAFTSESGYLAMTKLVNLGHPPSAVFVGSDVVALGAIEASGDYHLRVPDDISIIGFDDVPLGKYLCPALTTVHLPAFDLGWHAGDMMLKILRGQSLPATRVLLPTELVIRKSTARLETSQS